MRTIRDEVDEAAARLHSNQRHYLLQLDDYNATISGIRARCPHIHVVGEACQVDAEWRCMDCGAVKDEPFGEAM